MKYNPEIHHRRSIRLKGYDYSMSGAYFITICVQHNECRFGKIENKKMVLNDAGEMINETWFEMGNRFANIELDEFVVMPNHFHSIVFINDMGNWASTKPAPTYKNNKIDDKIVGATLVVDPNSHVEMAGIKPASTDSNNKINDEIKIIDDKIDGNWAGTKPAPADANFKINDVIKMIDDKIVGNSAGIKPAPTDKTYATMHAKCKTKPTVGYIVGAFKSITTNEYIEGVKNKIYPSFDRRLWQRNYHEHIIRNEESLNKIRTYIINNPENWDEDKFYSEIN